MNDVVFKTDLTPDSDGLAWGLIFRAGDYPDKDFRITAEELAEAAADFVAVDTDLEHLPTVLSGKLGKLEAVKVDGDSLYGGVREPEWLKQALGSDPRKVSATWDKAKKRLIGLAYTLNPRISDAQIVAAFTAFAGQRHSAADMRDMQTIHDLVVAQGAACAAAYTKEFHMDPEKKTDPALATMQQELAAMREQLATERTARYASDGKHLAHSLIGTSITPAQEPATAALFAQLAADDHASAATVTFSGADSKPVTANRVETLKSILAANTGLAALTGGQSIKANDPQRDPAKFALGDPGKQDDQVAKDKAEADEIMAATPLGRAAMKGTK